MSNINGSALNLLVRYAVFEPEVAAWSHFDPQALLNRIPAVEGANRKNGKLSGLAVGVKDIIDVAGMPTRHGCSVYKDAPTAVLDAACVAALRGAGAIPIGKTVTAELAFAVPGRTRNPWNKEHTPGGSSSGSAAAVAVGMVPLALGTQTGGSIIRPAAYCGVVGYKSSHGAISMAGVKRISDSFDSIGLFAGTIDQAVAAASVLLGLPDKASATFKLSELRIATIIDPAINAERPAERALSNAIGSLRRAGATISVAALDQNELIRLHQLHRAIMAYEMYRNLAPEYLSGADKIGDATRQVLLEGAAIKRKEHENNLTSLASLRNSIRSQLEHFHAVISYSALGPAPKGLHHTGNSVCNRLWSAIGWPALHLPTEISGDGLPLGIQLVCPLNEDELLLSVGSRVHSVIDLRSDSEKCATQAN